MLHRYINSRPLSHLICLWVPCHRHHQFHTNQRFWLDLTQGFWLDLDQVLLNLFNSRFLTGFESSFTHLIRPKVFDWIQLRFSQLDLNQGFQLDSTQFSQLNSNHSFWRDSAQGFPGFIRITFNAFIFNFIHIIRVTQQSGFRSPTLAKVSSK